MFSKNKKDKLDTNLNSTKCESPNCPSPETKYQREDCFDFEGKILCQFCYTKQLSEKPVENDYGPPRTKKITNVETKRITPNQVFWDSSNQSFPHLSRIGPSSSNVKYLEELSIWKEIFKHFKVDTENQQIKKINRLGQIKHTRIIDTTNKSIIASFVTRLEHTQKITTDQFLAKIFKVSLPNSTVYDFKDLPKHIQDWVVTNKIISILPNSLNELVLRLTIIEDKFFSLEQIMDQIETVELEPFLFELGRYFYFLNFIAYSFPFQIFFLLRNDRYLFLNANFTFSQNSFFNIKVPLQHLYLSIPIMLDENNFKVFFEGVSNERHQLVSMLVLDNALKEEIEQFFSLNHIMYNPEKFLISLDFAQEK